MTDFAKDPLWTDKYGPRSKALLARLDAATDPRERDDIDAQIALLTCEFDAELKISRLEAENARLRARLGE